MTKEIPKSLSFCKDDLSKVRSLLGKFRHNWQIETFREAAGLVNGFRKSIGLNDGHFINTREVSMELRQLDRLIDMVDLDLETGCRVAYKDTHGKVLGMTISYYVQVELDRTPHKIVDVLPTSLERVDS
jgi:hypothetical protein